MTDQHTPRSRRAVLAAALGGTGALVAASAVAPTGVLAIDPDDVARNRDNETTALTSITQTTDDTAAFAANGAGDGAGVTGTTESAVRAGVAGLSGDLEGSAWPLAGPGEDDAFISAGVYGFANQSEIAAGMWGESVDGIGLLGTGAVGIFAFGFDGIQALSNGGIAVAGLAFDNVAVQGVAFEGTGVQGHVGPDAPTTPTSPTALLGTVSASTQIGLQAHGRVRFPNRSGRATVGAGKSSVSVTVPGVTNANLVFAVLNGGGGGRWVRTAIPYTGKIVIHLSGPVTTATRVAWLVLG